MERYGRTTMEGSHSDPSLEWTTQGPETGLEESMWQLGLGGEESYPERPDEANCIYYLRTGYCGYGSRCRFNHPRDRTVATGVTRGEGGEYPERIGQPVCQYYMRTRACKFGASCKYHHPRQGGGLLGPVTLNLYGYPSRPGEKDCSYYMKTGQCKFGATCKFHHPQPAGIQLPVPSPAAAPVPTPTIYPPVQSPSDSSNQQYGLVVARPPLVQGSYVQSPYGTLLVSPGMVQFPSWNPYAAPVTSLPSPSTQPTADFGTLYGIRQLSSLAPAYGGSYQPIPAPRTPSGSIQKEQSFPQRPGQPECQYYMRKGECKFGSSCRYHHPTEVMVPRTTVVLSPMGFPLRPDDVDNDVNRKEAPGSLLCTHYAQSGVCKFGSACRFDHPMGTLSYSPSASSLADMPVAPYPVGSSIGMLAPSSSSSELRPELTSGSSKDSTSARMASSASTASESVGSTFSTSGTVSHSSLQQSAQSSAPSSSSRNTPTTTTESCTSS